MNSHKKNTYDLLVKSESEDKSRTVIEMLIYTIFILSAVVSIFQVAAQPVLLPSKIASKSIASQIEQAG